jgi:SAM-dependent methyltransferase
LTGWHDRLEPARRIEYAFDEMKVESTHQWGSQPEMFGPRHEHRLAMFVRRLDDLPEGSTVLDAAVGLGQLADRMRRRGHRTFGIDSSIEAARHALLTGSAWTVVGDLGNLPFREGAFDAVTSGETLEHLDDDRSAVGEIARVLREGGRCVVTVPALELLWTASDDYYEHRRRYDRPALRALFERAGLRVDRARYWGFPLVLIYDTLFLLPMNIRRSRRTPEGDLPLGAVAGAGRRRWLVRLVQKVFSLDRLFSFLPFGPGLVLVASKPGADER